MDEIELSFGLAALAKRSSPSKHEAVTALITAAGVVLAEVINESAFKDPEPALKGVEKALRDILKINGIADVAGEMH